MTGAASELPKQALGRTGLDVTRLAYGAMELRNDARGRSTSDEQAGRILNAVLDAGINLIDTSIDYGQSEERIGRHIAHRRSEYVLATKCGCPLGVTYTRPRSQAVGSLRRAFSGTPLWRVLRPLVRERLGIAGGDHVFTRENIVAGLEQSLRRMNTDYVDILQLHHAPSRFELEKQGAPEALLDLKRQGKVRFIGISSGLPFVTEHLAMGIFDVIQMPYSAFQREHAAFIHAAVTAGTGTVIRGGSRGLHGAAQGSHGAMWQRAGLGSIIGEMTPMEFNIRFTLSHAGVDSMLVGTVDPGHLAENIASAGKGPLPPEVLEAAVSALSGGQKAATSRS